MAIVKQNVPINFQGGLDRKSDPFQIPLGKFYSLENSVFTLQGRLSKRNGFGMLPPLPESASYTTTFNGNLTAIGSKLQAFSSGAASWTDKGTLQPVALEVLPLIRSNTNQSQSDAVVSSNNLVCTVFTDVGGSTTYKYAIADATTGQNLVAPTAISAADATYGTPRVFLLGNHFVIVFTNKVSTTYHLKYIAISTLSLTARSATDISTTYTPSSTVAFDGIVANNILYLAWNGSDIGGAVRMTYIDSTLTQHGIVTFATEVGTIFSLAADTASNTAVIYVTYYNLGTTTARMLAVNPGLVTILAPTTLFSSGTILNLATSANSGVCSVFYEVSNNYTYDSSVASHYVKTLTVTVAGVVSSATVFLRSVGLASKAFLNSGDTIYFLVTYSSGYQPTYFLVNGSANVIAKLAYSNGGGYLTLGLPSLTLTGSIAQCSYLIKDFVQGANKTQGVASSSPVYSQTGINLCSFDLGPATLSTAEIATNLHLSGGFLWMYDGYLPVEQNFHLWPDNVEVVGVSTVGHLIAQQYFYTVTYEWSDNQGNIFRSAPSVPLSFTILTAPATFTGNRTSGSAILASVSSTANLQVGQAISGTGIPAATYILSIDSSTQITMSANATSGSATSTTVTPTTLSSVTVNVPTLRLTYKTANPVKVVIYRWSTAQQTSYQTTSITAPTLNDMTVDSIAYVDSLADASIIGNNILYTTGNVVENIAAPATKAMALFKGRLVLIDSEDENLLWYSKQVIETVPVEMSDLFTIYVQPNVSGQGSTGNMKCVAAMDDKLIIFKKDALYYMTGDGPDNTGSQNTFSEPIFITSTVGCSNQASIVFIPNGLMFQSDKGIWLLERDLSTSYIGADVEAFNDSTVVSAVNIPGTNQVRFTLDSGVTLMYDYFYGQWGTFTGVPAISSTLYQDLHTFINDAGEVFQETPNLYLDGSSPVLMNWTTGWLNFEGLQGYQRLYYFYLLGVYKSPHKLTLNIAYDYSPYPSQSVTVNPNNYSGPWGSDATWGSASPFGGTPALEQWKINVNRQRCQAFQLSMNETFDPFFQTRPGAGLTLSGINCIIGRKKGYVPQPAAITAG